MTLPIVIGSISNEISEKQGGIMETKSIKDTILEVSRELVKSEGISSLNMRTVARKSGISVGSIYNYYESKSELIIATSRSIWEDFFEETLPEGSFIEGLEWYYNRLSLVKETYPEFFNFQSLMISANERALLRDVMKASSDQIVQHLLVALEEDENVNRDFFDEDLTPEEFVNAVFTLLAAQFIQSRNHPEGMLAWVRKSIYNTSYK